MIATAYTLGTKGLTAATPLATGDLLISGYLTRWGELDREGERMVRGAFLKSIPAALARASGLPLVYAHRLRDVLGTVLDLSEDAVGVKMLAKVNAQPPSSPLRWVYEALRNGSIRGLSAGAIFEKLARLDGTADIVGVDLVECSVTATPMLASTGFEVVSEGKALDWRPRPAAAPALAADFALLRARIAVERAALDVGRARLLLGV